MDDTVMTVFGAQQGAEDGYNPRYHGRPSYKAKVAFVAGSGELVNAGLYGGKTASNGEFLPFFQETLTLLPPRTVVEGVRMDKGLVPLKDSIRKIIAYLRILNVPGNVVGNDPRRTYGGFGWFCRYTSFQRAYEAR